MTTSIQAEHGQHDRGFGGLSCRRGGFGQSTVQDHRVQQMPELAQELHDVDALRHDEAEIERQL